MNFSSTDYSQQNSTFTQIPVGLHNARIFMVALVGTIKNTYYNSEQLTLTIGLEIAPVVPGGRNEIRYHHVTASMGSKAELRRIIEGIERKTLTQEEAGAYSMESLLGRFVQVEFLHNPSKKDPSKVYEKISKFFHTEREFPTKKSTFMWDFHRDELSQLPQSVQQKAMQTREYQEKYAHTPQPQTALGQTVHVANQMVQPPPAPVQPPPAPVQKTQSFDWE